jgi:hypothetical protein
MPGCPERNSPESEAEMDIFLVFLLIAISLIGFNALCINCGIWYGLFYNMVKDEMEKPSAQPDKAKSYVDNALLLNLITPEQASTIRREFRIEY